MSRIDMDGVFSTNHKALDLIPLDLIPVSLGVVAASLDSTQNTRIQSLTQYHKRFTLTPGGLGIASLNWNRCPELAPESSKEAVRSPAPQQLKQTTHERRRGNVRDYSNESIHFILHEGIFLTKDYWRRLFNFCTQLRRNSGNSNLIKPGGIHGILMIETITLIFGKMSFTAKVPPDLEFPPPQE